MEKRAKKEGSPHKFTSGHNVTNTTYIILHDKGTNFEFNISHIHPALPDSSPTNISLLGGAASILIALHAPALEPINLTQSYKAPSPPYARTYILISTAPQVPANYSWC